jgi:hypothetical protein
MNLTNPVDVSAKRKSRRYFRRRRRRHDPMLVLNMSIFNFESGWDRIFNPFRQHTNTRW